jgi:hypothetical protein
MSNEQAKLHRPCNSLTPKLIFILLTHLTDCSSFHTIICDKRSPYFFPGKTLRVKMKCTKKKLDEKDEGLHL